MKQDLEIKTNRNWGKNKKPSITIVTPLYNRRDTIGRTMKSIDSQTFRDIEYIIVDDGSPESAEDIITRFMDSTDLPVMYIKKKNNGGAHTAKNVGDTCARGELIIHADSDDELLPDACEIFHKTWLSIPKDKRKEYWVIVARCVDETGKLVGDPFPNNINDLPREKMNKFLTAAKGDHFGCHVAKILKDNLFLQPEDVTFVIEGTRWLPLEHKYRSWAINDAALIYHTEGNDHLSRGPKMRKKQNIRNYLWNEAYKLNNQDIFELGFKRRMITTCKAVIFSEILSRYYKDYEFLKKNKLRGFRNKAFARLVWLPSLIVAKKYYRDRCDKGETLA